MKHTQKLQTIKERYFWFSPSYPQLLAARFFWDEHFTISVCSDPETKGQDRSTGARISTKELGALPYRSKRGMEILYRSSNEMQTILYRTFVK